MAGKKSQKVKTPPPVNRFIERKCSRCRGIERDRIAPGAASGQKKKAKKPDPNYICDTCYEEIWDRGFESTTQHAEEIARGQDIEEIIHRGLKHWERRRRKLARSKKFTKVAVTRLIGMELMYLREKGLRLKDAFSQGVIAEHETWRSPERYGLGQWWDDKCTVEVDSVDELEVKSDGDTHQIIASCTMKRENSPPKTGVKIHLMVYAREPFGKGFDISLLAYDGHRM